MTIYKLCIYSSSFFFRKDKDYELCLIFIHSDNSSINTFYIWVMNRLALFLDT